MVMVGDRHGRLHKARLLLDNGSTANFVTDRLCTKLGLVRRDTSSTVTGIDNQATVSTQLCNLTIVSNNGGYRVSINCHILPDITKSIPTSHVNIQHIPIPTGINLADPSFNVPSSIDILVGAEIFWSVLGSSSIKLGKKLPVLQESQLGWLVTGSIPQSQLQSSVCYFVQNNEPDLSRFWEFDAISPTHCMSQEERECEASFSEHTSRNADGRFVVTIPLKESPDVLGDSYNMARRRFMSLEKRFERDPVLKEHYTKFMQEYIDLGHMTENTINVPQDNKVSYYIPHHGLFQPKCRVVFDAGAASTSGKSFNDIQKIGPTVQDDLFSILVRFRQHKYVVTADVEKMYRAIEVNPSQRSLQQIIYRSEPYLPLKTYTLNTLTYGCSSAPYLATKCLVSLADQVQDDKVKYAIQRNFYVDDYLDGDDSLEKLKHTCQQVISTLDSAKLNLRKWQSNSTDILQTVMDLKGTPLNNKSLDLNENTSCKTLGLYWSCSQDMLLFSINLKHNPNSKVTKRHILSTINQIFDPLGLVGPCVMEVKDIMRKLWSAKYDWDDEVSVEIKNLWHTFEDTLPKINNLRIPRWILCDEPSSIELHTFTDASERAYGTCIYARTVGKNGTVDVHLLVSKNKIAPIKPTTIPRLELSGALMGSRLCTKVKSALTVNAQCFFWSDSTIVLGWLSSPTNQLKQFVRNRVYEIQESTSGHKWSYVPSKDNPADLVSRGVRADAIGESSLWWSGPSFLSKPCCDWPVMPNVKEQSLPEIVLFSNAEDSHKVPNPIANLIHNRSSFTNLVRILAYVLRFINKCHKKESLHGHHSLSELQRSKVMILKMAQKEMFPEEYSLLQSDQSLPAKNRLLSLSPFLDEDGLIRVGGRLKNSFYSFDVKHPILLCSKHHITKILFRLHHISFHHAGPQLLLANVRQTYWPLGGRNLAKSTARACAKCCRFKAATVQPIMGNLPNSRVHLQFPFLNTAIDYAGPILIADRKGRGCRLIKCYIAVFVCLAVKAVHIELVTGLTKEAFMAALSRFIARRGRPQNIHSDQGTSFVGASNELQRFLRDTSDDISGQLADDGIKFNFIPPYTPHFGGLWEAAVKSVKFHLRRVLGLAHLTYEEMSTCLSQIEAILNSRPLTPLPSDPSNDFTALTPAHFLIGRSLMSVPHPQVTDANIKLLPRYQRVEQIRQHFWNRFSNEYLSLLQQKTKWHRSSPEQLMEGTLVLVKDRTMPPLLWPLGRIIKVHPGTDGITRVVDVLTKKGTIQRAYNNICPLPTS
ncbi:unnamed protein product [Plutella xylostella]|uniref:(diamondback moth) hypothetical protein n=1 Tax=Plutella xylostella TaxID=51655 RepID=A0A8S4GD66_PLUXY|nr:unnamed protein product [Plutella xylostella]